MMTKNIFYYSFIISLLLHICFFSFGYLIKPEKEDEFHKLTIIPISQKLNYKSNFKEIKSFKKKENLVLKDTKDNKKIEENIYEQKEINKKVSDKIFGGNAEILKSLSENKISDNSSGNNFVVQEVSKNKSKNKREGIGLGEGDDIGVDDNNKVAMVKENDISQEEFKTEQKLKIDKDKVLREYQILILKEIEKNKIYPEEARRENFEGKVKVKFGILSSGKVGNIELISSSGFDILDKEAIFTIKKCSPFPPIPKELELTNLNFTLPIVFELK